MRRILATVIFFYSLSPSARAQDNAQMIDLGVLTILKTQTGQKALCPFAFSPETIRLYLGVSEGQVATVTQLCGTRFLTPFNNHVLRNIMMVHMPGEGPRTPAKEYKFLGPTSELPHIASYTNKFNVTSFLLTEKELAGPEFIRSLAHELAFSYDQLSIIGSLGMFNRWDAGLSPLHGHDLYGPSILKNPDQNAEPLICALRDPAIRYALATERAFRFEDAVIHELKWTQNSPAEESHNFRAAVQRYSKLTAEIAALIDFETSRYGVRCGEPASDPAARAQEINARVALLESIALEFIDGSPSTPLLKVLLQPHVGPNARDLDCGGPRPRMAGW